MLVITVMLWCVASSTSAKEVVSFYGSVFKTDSVIDLQSNITSYSVGCMLEATKSGVDSRFLAFYQNNTKVDSQIVNDTTIELKVDLLHNNESTICGVKTYLCRLNQTREVHSTTIFIGEPPQPIDLADFRCISENREYLVCDWPRNDYCNLHTWYQLVMIRHHMPSSCELVELPAGRIQFDSRSETCSYSATQRSITFELESRNFIGNTTIEYHFDHYDLVRPAAPKFLEISNVTTTSFDVTWSLSTKLLNLDRQLEFQFLLVSEYGVEESAFTNLSFRRDERLSHSLQGLTPYTHYKLSIRLRVVPNQPRPSENDYWSDWSSATIKTKACRPFQAPATLPGAYSLREITGSFATVDVFWLKIPQYLHNGGRFRYDVSAIDKSGTRYLPSSVSNETATFHHLKLDYYRVEITCQNVEGPADGVSVIEIYPPAEDLKPTIKRILLLDDYQLSWYPVPQIDKLLNYTIVYCNFTATGTCRDGVQFATVSASETVFHISSKQVLNFAIAANYRDHSSDLSWQKCVVSGDTGIGQPKFSVTDMTMDSFVIRIDDSCTDRSLVERYEITVSTKVPVTLGRSFFLEPYISVVTIDGLSSATEYRVLVTAFHESGSPQHKKAVVRTAQNGSLWQSILYALGGLVILIAVCIHASRKVKKMMNIKVDIPLGLVGIDDSRTVAIPNDHREKVDSNHIVSEQEVPSVVPAQRKLDENSNLPILAQLSATSNNLERLRKTVHTATDNLYISPEQMTPSPVKKPKENQFSAISTASSGYVDLNQIVKSQDNRSIVM
ncbi:uncharacterized protein LOC129728763 isoform X2 [Wyeomyia smithii]|uniref:uncharacterized protein LOC129728763 isoform X2 n=1 Tax=Wyeomyia smithii TaxID=174621 RepID=UPI002467F6D3|nr:uncharacterized protein LOC129728763 isoform X2 [Wyeomyia smithii]